MRSLTRRTLTHPLPAYTWTAEVCGNFPWSKDCKAVSNPADAIHLARIRGGHTPLLKAYANLLESSADPLCRLYKEEAQTIEPWLLICPRLDATRQHNFGSPYLPPRF